MSMHSNTKWPFPINNNHAYAPPLTKINKASGKKIILLPPPESVVKTKDLTLTEVNNYVKDHGTLLPNGQVFLTKPLKVFKKVYRGYDGCIANLVLPKGTLVNLAKDGNKKMRASMAVCHSIYDLKGNYIPEARSDFDSKFKYAGLERNSTVNRYFNLALDKYFALNKYSPWFGVPAKYIINPQYPFSTDGAICDSGIHFFVELNEAKNYG